MYDCHWPSRASGVAFLHPSNRLVEGDEEIGQEIPECDHADGKELGHVEIDLEFSNDQPEHQVVDTKSDQGDHQEFRILDGNIRVVAFESPYPVQDIVGRGSDGKTDGIGNIFLDLEDLLEKVGKGIVDKKAGKANCRELYELQDKGTAVKVKHACSVSRKDMKMD